MNVNDLRGSPWTWATACLHGLYIPSPPPPRPWPPTNPLLIPSRTYQLPHPAAPASYLMVSGPSVIVHGPSRSPHLHPTACVPPPPHVRLLVVGEEAAKGGSWCSGGSSCWASGCEDGLLLLMLLTDECSP